jgi:hypothetical protein
MKKISVSLTWILLTGVLTLFMGLLLIITPDFIS